MPGPGIFFALALRTGRPCYADRLSVVRNKILRNGLGAGTQHGGIVFIEGQADGGGHAAISGNTISGNDGAALAGQSMGFTVDARGNDLSGNLGGAYSNVRLANGRRSVRV